MDRAAILDRATDSAKRSCKPTSRPASTWRQRLLLALATGPDGSPLLYLLPMTPQHPRRKRCLDASHP